jgi:hypothetical protein
MKARARVARKRMPRFSSEDEERQFWTGHDTVDFFDWGKAVRATFPELRPSTANISLRLPASMLAEGLLGGAHRQRTWDAAQAASLMPNTACSRRRLVGS